MVIVPLGSTEQHGPHLPVDTDTIIAVAVAQAVAGRLAGGARPTDVVVAPAIGYGASGEHQDFPGTISIGHRVLHLQLVELTRSLSTWAGRVVMINAHGGNLKALVEAVCQLIREGHDVCWTPCAAGGSDAHAGHVETSLVLHLAPHLVEMSRAGAGNVAPLEDLLPTLVARGVSGVSANGVLGDPTRASAADGARIFASVVDDVASRIVNNRPASDGCLQRSGAAGAESVAGSR